MQQLLSRAGLSTPDDSTALFAPESPSIPLDSNLVGTLPPGVGCIAREAERTVASGLTAGMEQPRGLSIG